MSGVIVDGQDVAAVYEATQTAVDAARRGEGPTLIEAKTYRFDEHCRNLNVPIPYRTEEELNHYQANRDPLLLYKEVLLTAGIPATELQAIETEVAEAVQAAVDFAHDSPFPKPEEVYDYMYSDPIHYPPVDANNVNIDTPQRG